MEDKQKILDLLLQTLQATRRYSGMKSIYYIKDEEDDYAEAVIELEDGRKIPVNVSMDSGLAMIRDVIRHL